ncbi:M14 family metallopeptidase [Flavisphingopyxis soli]|uniref:M14 family metallopeptidase n=1 Tax=Flavisphingopyxis soli TaxID=2601267 RepID=UPI0013760EBC|nr:M14 family metallopeptidase [Sphingorhabdus soli]
MIEGERSFSLVIAPEHAPPINPSPWYAFRYSAQPGGDVTVRLSYLEAKHRYAPKLTRNGVVSELPVSIANDERSALVTLPEGSGTVSAQPMLSSADYAAFARDLVRDYGGERLDLGRSLDGRPIEAIRFGDVSADATIVILGRQHPPEVTGFYALEPFVRALARSMQQDKLLGTRYQILAVPLLNPDGVDRGHWRANRGGVDLNRDWGAFTQPETRAVRDWLASHAKLTRPVVMIDFHSTARNLFYVQGDEAGATNARFLETWLAGKEAQFTGYPFTIEKRNANPGSGTAKNWFFECFAIPAYTYEVDDDANPAETATAARLLAADFVLALPALARSDVSPRRDTGGRCLPDAIP